MTDPALAEVERALAELMPCYDWCPSSKPTHYCRICTTERPAVVSWVLEREAGLIAEMAAGTRGELDRAWAVLGTNEDEAADDPDTEELYQCIEIALQYERDKHEHVIEQRDSLLAENAALKKDHEADQCALRIGISEHARKDAELELLKNVEAWARQSTHQDGCHPSEGLHTEWCATLRGRLNDLDKWRKARGEGEK